MASPTAPQRQPPPTLFPVPPSHNSSRTSLPSLLSPTSPAPTPAQSRVPLLRNLPSRNAPPTTSSAPNPPPPTTAAGGAPPATLPPAQRHQPHPARNRTSALWTEMQRTLSEVSHTATTPTHLFGPSHSSALSRLRASQIALAQAWARSEEATDDVSPADQPAITATTTTAAATPAAAATAPANPPPTSQNPSSPSSDSAPQTHPPSSPIDSTNDILLSRLRRTANDRFFQRVNSGMLDVVAMLEEVAVAMRDVERESRDIWSDDEDAAEDGGGSRGEAAATAGGIENDGTGVAMAEGSGPKS
ncbi:hypothetical protein FGG08_007412 [Glutinoglossum americanum]|uniref:Uncharacterized protein n=1 Tax=Glutinoglossum americanum TaxID=1670608 RepID=A0A9P8HYW2_9PEZI|nr:hypothetical protein FGG08_007412 [Glutinoglossum americanum]